MHSFSSKQRLHCLAPLWYAVVHFKIDHFKEKSPTTLVVVSVLWPHIALRSLDVRMTAIVPQAVVTDNRLGINGCHAISRLYQATLMSCGTVKHVCVDCTITLLHFGVVESFVKLMWVSFSDNANAH